MGPKIVDELSSHTIDQLTHVVNSLALVINELKQLT